MRAAGRRDSRAAWTAFGLVVLLMADLGLDRLSAWVAVAYLAVGALSALLYVADKRAAERGAWRISEANLHTVDAFGGVVGGLLAQELLRHKTSKRSFRAITWAIAGVHAMVLITLLLGYWPALTRLLTGTAAPS